MIAGLLSATEYWQACTLLGLTTLCRDSDQVIKVRGRSCCRRDGTSWETAGQTPRPRRRPADQRDRVAGIDRPLPSYGRSRVVQLLVVSYSLSALAAQCIMHSGAASDKLPAAVRKAAAVTEAAHHQNLRQQAPSKLRPDPASRQYPELQAGSTAFRKAGPPSAGPARTHRGRLPPQQQTRPPASAWRRRSPAAGPPSSQWQRAPGRHPRHRRS